MAGTWVFIAGDYRCRQQCATIVVIRQEKNATSQEQGSFVRLNYRSFVEMMRPNGKYWEILGSKLSHTDTGVVGSKRATALPR
jgi:hypothetical protein